MSIIPAGAYLTTYGIRADVMLQMPWEDLLSKIETGVLQFQLGPVFKLDDIAEAHRCMDENRAEGKIVILT